MKKQSSIEYLYSKMFEHHGIITIEEFQEAKELHKQEIINAHGNQKDYTNQIDPSIITGELYYNKTFNL